MRSILHYGIGTVMAATLALGAATPAAAGDYRGYGYNGGGYHGGGYHGGYGHDRGGSGIGDFLLGAALIGGIAAIATAASAPRAPAYDRGYAPGYDRAPVDYRSDRDTVGYADTAVDQCARAAERAAQSDGGFARVTGIDRVQPYRDGARVFGTLQVDYRYDDRPGERAHTRFDCTANGAGVTGLRLG